MSRKPPSKATLKLGKNVQSALLNAEKKALEFDGFESFTHEQSWDDFPGSLRVKCFFSDAQALQNFTEAGKEEAFRKVLQMSFLKVGIKFRDIRKNILFTFVE